MRHLDVLDLRGDRSDPTDRLPRPLVALGDVQTDVRAILEAVRDGGDGAVRELTARFDGVEVDTVEVPRERIDQALADVDPNLRDALRAAADQVRWFHEHAMPQDWTEERGGARVGQRFRPLARVGAYVPGGLVAYPSSVIMAAVPARVAGVDEIVLCTPPSGGDGWPDPTILAAAGLLGVDRVFRIGGAQAVAAMAYGTDSVPRCDKIVGPGNRWVASAKLQVQADGVCGVEGFAGPTEIAIIADASADPALIAADLVAQAEHDELATCLLVTTDPDLLPRVEDELDREISGTRHQERVREALEGQGTAVLVDDIERAVAVVDAFAPEHLEIHTVDARAVAERVRFAGAVFVGASTPVSLGDYAAGPNHTLPTARTARFRGGLTTADFLVTVNVVEYAPDELARLAPVVRELSAAEDLPAHGRAVAMRSEDDRG
ncbi:MAG: histidinol dehydrogenase [Actinobacteria bacterium]|nr:histidinol dehydrogenase [Actinomycetota bacterium]